MTPDVKLLPLPEGEAIGWSQAWSHDQMHDYARANMEPLLAENERLRAEVDEWKRRGEAYFQTAERQGKRAERLAEALRDALEYLKHHLPDDMLEMHRAALDQEGGNG